MEKTLCCFASCRVHRGKNMHWNTSKRRRQTAIQRIHLHMSNEVNLFLSLQRQRHEDENGTDVVRSASLFLSTHLLNRTASENCLSPPPRCWVGSAEYRQGETVTNRINEHTVQRLRYCKFTCRQLGEISLNRT